MSGFSFSKLKQAKPSMRRRLFLYMGALAALLLVTLFAVLLLLGQLKSPREELAKSLTEWRPFSRTWNLCGGTSP